MTAPRVGKKELLRPTPTTARPSTTFVLSRALASPFGILIVLPAIVLAVGLFLTLQGQSTLRASNVSLGQKRLSDQAQVVASHLRAALGQADAVLDRLFDFALTHAPDKPIEPAAAVLYDLLAQLQPSPVVDLNRAVAVAMRDGPAAGLTLLDEILARGELAEYHLAHSARAELCRRLDRTDEARAAYAKALSLTRQEPERRFLARRLAEL